MDATKEQVAAWKKKHGKIYKLEVTPVAGERVTLYFAKADFPLVSAYMRNVPTDPQMAQISLLKNTLLHPSQKELFQLFENYPGVTTAIVVPLMDKLGFTADVTIKEV
ncbi:hypothetical protein ES703_04177 [subsurface metagenome]|nr:hypothetical protein [bacterium]